MRKLIVLMAVIAVGLVACGSKESAKSGLQNPSNVTSNDGVGYKVSAEDQVEFIRVFEAYLAMGEERTDNVLGFMKESGITTPQGREDFKRNRLHVDSLMHRFIALTKEGKYGTLYALLEKERMNIQRSPGSTVENYLDMTMIVRTLGEQKYANNKTDYYKMIVDWDEFAVTLMGALKVLGKGTHPEYLNALVTVAKEYEEFEQVGKVLEAWNDAADAAKEEGANMKHIAIMIHLSDLCERNGMKENADSCLDAVKNLPEYGEVKKALAMYNEDECLYLLE